MACRPRSDPRDLAIFIVRTYVWPLVQDFAAERAWYDVNIGGTRRKFLSKWKRWPGCRQPCTFLASYIAMYMHS